MRVGTYPTRNFATFGPSELRPPFTGASLKDLNLYELTLQHRAGVRPYTSFLDFAESCVFNKQSLPPNFLRALKKPSFLPKLQDNFAEFLQYCYLYRLNTLRANRPVLVLGTVFINIKITISRAKMPSLFLKISIDYSFHILKYHLRNRLTLRGLTFRRNPSISGDNFYKLFYVTHVSIRYSDIST